MGSCDGEYPIHGAPRLVKHVISAATPAPLSIPGSPRQPRQSFAVEWQVWALTLLVCRRPVYSWSPGPGSAGHMAHLSRHWICCRTRFCPGALLNLGLGNSICQTTESCPSLLSVDLKSCRRGHCAFFFFFFFSGRWCKLQQVLDGKGLLWSVLGHRRHKTSL